MFHYTDSHYFSEEINSHELENKAVTSLEKRHRVFTSDPNSGNRVLVVTHWKYPRIKHGRIFKQNVTKNNVNKSTQRVQTSAKAAQSPNGVSTP